MAAVETAITAAKNLSSTYGAESGSGTPVTINGTTTINASAGFLDPSGAHLFTASSFSIGNGHTVTIYGTASDFVVIDITGNSGNKLDGALTLTGGITPDQVLINFIGSGGNVQGAANGATLEGTFLIPDEGVQLNSLTIDGHLFGGEAGDNFQLVSNSFVAQPSLTPPPRRHRRRHRCPSRPRWLCSAPASSPLASSGGGNSRPRGRNPSGFGDRGRCVRGPGVVE